MFAVAAQHGFCGFTFCDLYLFFSTQPTVSVGNVAQLTVDLLVSTLAMNRTGYILHESILPMCGNNPFASNKDKGCDLCTSCEGGLIPVQREREMFYLTTHSTLNILSTVIGIRHMVKDHSDSEKGNPLPPPRLLLSINSKGSFICTIQQTG